MKQQIVKWFPFIILISVAAISAVYLFLFGKTDPYEPLTDDPRKIYREACMHCHGQNGEGSGLLYPAFEHDNLKLENIRKNIVEGAFLMPSFENIRGDTLDSLVLFIYQKKYDLKVVK